MKPAGIVAMVLALVVAGAAAGSWLVQRLGVGFTLSNQPGTVLLPKEITVSARMAEKLTIGLNGQLKAQVPLNQTLEIPIKGRYDTVFDVDSDVNVKFKVEYTGALPVDTIADIEATTDFNFQDVKTYRRVSFKAKLPMKFDLPVTLRVPVDENVRIKFKGPLKATFDYLLVTPVNTTINTVLNVNQTITTPVTSSFRMTMQLPQDARKVIINHADLRLPLKDLRFEGVKGDTQARTDSPWGS